MNKIEIVFHKSESSVYTFPNLSACQKYWYIGCPQLLEMAFEVLQGAKKMEKSCV